MGFMWLFRGLEGWLPSTPLAHTVGVEMMLVVSVFCVGIWLCSEYSTGVRTYSRQYCDDELQKKIGFLRISGSRLLWQSSV